MRLLRHLSVVALAVACIAGWGMYLNERSERAEERRMAEGNLRLLSEKAAYGMKAAVERSRDAAAGRPASGPMP